MKTLSIIVLILSFTSLSQAAYKVSFASKELFMNQLSQVEDFKHLGVVEIPYQSLRKKIPNVVLLDTAAVAAGHDEPYRIGKLGIEREDTLNYVDVASSPLGYDQLYLAHKVGDIFVCYLKVKKKWKNGEWGKREKIFDHCFIFPKSVDKVVEALKSIIKPEAGPR